MLRVKHVLEYVGKSEWLDVKVGVKQGCVMSPWLFDMFMDGIMREVMENAGDIGASMWDARRIWEWKLE